MHLKIIAAAALAFVIGATAADAAPQHRRHHARATEPANPAPAETARLMAFRGVWMFDGTVTMGVDKPRKLRWRLGCAQTAGGWALACDDTIHIPRTPVMREHDLFAYDAATGTVHFYMANSMGETRELLGKWTDDHTIDYRYAGTRGGKPLVEELHVVMRDATTFDLDDKVTVGGQPEIAFHGTFHQVPKRARRARNAPPADDQPAPETPPQ